ncbi:MAG: VCBS repeat-containing protein [Spirosomataceae bacterium]
MKKYPFILFLLLTFASCQKKKSVFTRLSPEQTGVHFVNQITESDSVNILVHDYVYNGGGVGIADFNNDGLQDIFFSANQSGNKLYLNKGNMAFEDISDKAGIVGKGTWNTAVTVVDINQDGWLDVYVPVSSTTNVADSLRRNLLFINQKNLTFLEMGREYGVDDDGFSEGAAFFDYDNDGDLDLYVLTDVIDQSPNLIREKVTDGSYPNTDRLYKNEWNEKLGHPVFTNVSKEAGITMEGFGLGINICDINRDGWKDIYITNDFAADDLLYINNQDGTFRNDAAKYFKHTSNSAMGNDVVDINNDGLADIIALDMSPRDNQRKKMFVPSTNISLYILSDKYNYIHQYMRNTLQLNSGLNGHFQEISLLANVAETDWSWTPSVADFDHDGYRDLLITNGFPKDITDKDFMQYRANSERIAGIDYLLTQIPEVKISNYAFKNTGKLYFEDVTEEWGLQIPSFSSGAAYGDLDNDGDLDYVVNNTNDPAFIYQNNTIDTDKKEGTGQYLRVKFKGDTQNPYGLGVILEAKKENGEILLHEFTPYRGYKSSVEPIAHLGIGEGKITEMRVIWPNGKMQILKNPTLNTTLNLRIEEATRPQMSMLEEPTPLFTEQKENFNLMHEESRFYDFNVQNLMPHLLSKQGPSLSVGDINKDGLDDLFVGGSKYKNGQIFFQNTAGQFEYQPAAFPKLDSAQKISEDIGSLLFDADADGWLDLYVVSGGNEDFPEAVSFQDRLYKNKGNGEFEHKPHALPKEMAAGSCVRAVDFDGDGDLDLFVAGRNVPTEYPKAASSFLLRNDSKKGEIKFTDVTASHAPILTKIGMVTDAIWTDFDSNGVPDLILVGEYMPVTFLKNEKGKLEKIANTGVQKQFGLWNSINGADFDADGDIDYIVGNVGKNGLFQGNEKYPAKVLSGDFDQNGNYDVFPFIYLPESEINKSKILVPLNGKEDISKQYNGLRMRFTTFQEYTKATFDTFLTKEEKKKATEHTLNFTASVYLENKGNGKFEAHALPIEAQFAPMNGIVVEDFNQDGQLDFLAVGNNFSNELLVGRYDAANGFLALGDGKGNFAIQKRTGFLAEKDAKSLVFLKGANEKMKIIVGQNSAPAKLFETSLAGRFIALQPTQTKISYQWKGKNITREVYYGASYLSQSSRFFFLPQGAKLN